jgi:hypothetical protein
MSHIFSHNGNVNQNNTEIPPHHSQWLSSRKQTMNAGEDAGERETLHSVGEKANQ